MKDEKKNAVPLSDADLEGVTGGTGNTYQYWFSSASTNAEKCTDPNGHHWELSPTGSYEYCTKCNAERYKQG